MSELELTLTIIKYGALGGFTILMAYLTWMARELREIKRGGQKQALFGMSQGKDIETLLEDKKELETWKKTIEHELNEIKIQLAKKGK